MNDQGPPSGSLITVSPTAETAQHPLPPPKHTPLPFDVLASAVLASAKQVLECEVLKEGTGAGHIPEDLPL